MSVYQMHMVLKVFVEATTAEMLDKL